MDAAETIVLPSTVDGAPAGWKFLKFKDVDEYTKISYVRKTTFKVAVFVDEYGVYHDYYSPKDPEDDRRPNVNVWCLVNKAEGITYFFYDNDNNDSRGLRPIENFLGAFETGTIQSDAYVVYELLTNGNEKLKHVLCWAHERNRFEEAFLSSKDAIADWFVKTIAELYRIETECILARMTPEKIRERRNKKDVDSILKRLYQKACEYLDHKKKHYIKMTQDAMKYMKNGWKDLIRYRDDGNYDIDNLIAERAIRPFTVHRKNAHSFGCEDGVQETCLFFTLC